MRNWHCVNHIPGIHDNGPRDHELWRRTLTAYYKRRHFLTIAWASLGYERIIYCDIAQEFPAVRCLDDDAERVDVVEGDLSLDPAVAMVTLLAPLQRTHLIWLVQGVDVQWTNTCKKLQEKSDSDQFVMDRLKKKPIWDSETFIDFVQGPPRSRRERVKFQSLKAY